MEPTHGHEHEHALLQLAGGDPPAAREGCGVTTLGVSNGRGGLRTDLAEAGKGLLDFLCADSPPAGRGLDMPQGIKGA